MAEFSGARATAGAVPRAPVTVTSPAALPYLPPAAAAGGSVIACVAVVGRVNNPLYIRNFSGDEFMKLQLAVYTSLDIIEERIQGPSKKSSTATDPYLGMLCPMEDTKVYGYITNTRAKLVVVLRDVLIRDPRIRDFLKRLHYLYVDAVCNPFAVADERITSPKFDAAVARLVAEFNPLIETGT